MSTYFRGKCASLIIPWPVLYGYTFISASLYVFFEWLFVITKPSFLNTVSILRKIGILIFTCSVITGLLFAILGVIYLLSLLLQDMTSARFLIGIGMLIPALVLASMAVLLVDNFTYTVFRFGIVSSSGFTTGVYICSFLLLVYYFYCRSTGVVTWLINQRLSIPGMVMAAILLFLVTYQSASATNLVGVFNADQENARYPNILLITGDGIDANHLSIYGYDRETTPHISELAQTSLVVRNAFSNAGHTAGSLISIYTSKYPTQLRVLYPPDILKGTDSYQHLPGILNTLGYLTVQYTTPYFGDAYTLNLLYGFDIANGRSINQSSVYSKISHYIQTDYAYFLYEITNRWFDRSRHIFFIKKMDNYQALIQGKAQRFDDTEKVDSILSLIANKNRPFFIHLHWMGTHGPTYLPQVREFSKGKSVETQKLLDDDFYDDSLLEFDEKVGKLVEKLSRSGLLDDTMIVIGSDHNRGWSTTQKIPLLIHFPEEQYAGVRKANIQNMDIAPTVMDYLGIKKPAWMAGTSSLRIEPENRPIFSGGADIEELVSSSAVAEVVHPPFYQFGYVSMVYCDTWYRLDLSAYELTSGQVSGHNDGCEDSITREQALGWMIQHLKEGGFDVSELEIGESK